MSTNNPDPFMKAYARYLEGRCFKEAFPETCPDCGACLPDDGEDAKEVQCDHCGKILRLGKVAA